MSGSTKRPFEGILFGDPQRTSLHERIFNVVILLIVFTTFAAGITNFFLLGAEHSVRAFGSSFMTLGVYFYARKTGKHELLSFLVSITLMVVMIFEWFSDKGTLGTVIFYFFMLIVAADSMLSKGKRNLFLFIILSVVTILIGWEFFYPQDVMLTAKNYRGRLCDFAVAFYLGIFSILSLVRMVIRQYVRDRETIKKAAEEIKTLRGFLPICAKCKKIRDQGGYWNQLEKYVTEHSEAEFTHSLCPECLKSMYGVDS